MPPSALFTKPSVEAICLYMKRGDNAEHLDAIAEMFAEVGNNELDRVVADLRKEA
jgi:hypothetical protein